MPGPLGWLALALAPGLGPVRARALIERAGGLAPLLRRPPSRWKQAVREGQARARRLAPELARREVFLLTPADEDWPEALAAAPAAPLVLFGSGRRQALRARPRIAVAGSRRALAETRLVLRAWGEAWAGAGALVCAGLEGAADRAVLEGAAAAQGAPAGLAAAGPGALAGTAAETARAVVAAGGAVLSELPPGVQAGKGAWARRAQLLAMLADALVVAEADARSRALGVARFALELGREVAAMPGPVWSERFRGAHRLIRSGALLVDAPEQVLEALGCEASPREARPQGLAGEEAAIWALLAEGPGHVDMLAERLGLTMERLLPILLALEMKGVVERLPGGRYARR